MLYQIVGNKLEQVNSKPFALERDLQRLFENNLQKILGLSFIQTEFVISNRRFDTLAFDEKNKSFVIIEYKNCQNSSLIDQGFTYLGLLLNHKDTFKMALVDKGYGKDVYNNIDWSQSKLIFVSPAFNDMQKQSVINFNDLPLELLEVTKYANNCIFIHNIVKTGNVSYKQATKNIMQEQITKEVVVYTESTHLDNKPEEIKELYETVKEQILSVYPFSIDVRKQYIAFKKEGKNICDIEIQKKQLLIYFNAKKDTLTDYKHLLKDLSDKHHWGNGDYCIAISDEQNIDYAKTMLSQLLDLNRN